MTAVSSPPKPRPAKPRSPILNPGQLHARLEEIKARMGPPPLVYAPDAHR